MQRSRNSTAFPCRGTGIAVLVGALLCAGPSSSSAFVSVPPAIFSSRQGQQQRASFSVINHGLRRSRTPPASRRTGVNKNSLSPATTAGAGSAVTTNMIFGGLGGGGEAMLPTVGAIVSNAVGQAHANLLGSGVGALLLAEETKPPNIYGPIAQGGVFIVLSGVLGAYIVTVITMNMSAEDLAEINKELSGRDQVDELESQRKDLEKRLKTLTKDMEEAVDPTLGMGIKPAGKRADRIDETTERALQTDIASIEDEYDD